MIAERETGNRIRATAARQSTPHVELPEPMPEDEAPDPERQASSRRDLGALLEHLSTELLPRDLAIFRMVFTDGAAPAEVGRALGVSTQVVYNRVHHIRSLAKAFLSS